MLASLSQLRGLGGAIHRSRDHVRRGALARPQTSRFYVPKVALFGDTHFQDRGLKRIVKTADWIIDEVENRKCDAVICLGDVLNTRELVSVRALSAALSFFDRLSTRLNHRIPVHILLGNHDINLKHSRRFSSLDALSLKAMSNSGIVLHRELTIIPSLVGSTDFIALPYHEETSDIVEFLETYVKEHGKDKAKSTIVVGHLAVAGAQQNNTPYRYRGPLRTSNFAAFKRTFSGHFHHHHELPKNRVVYVGSTMQFNFGDSGDYRGIVIYDTDTDTYELVHNPFGEQYIRESDTSLLSRLPLLLSSPEFASHGRVTVDFAQLDNSKIPDNRYKDKFVQVQMESADLSNDSFDQIREMLFRAGASGVTKTVQNIKTLIQGQGIEATPESSTSFRFMGTSSAQDIENMLWQFAKAVRESHLESLKRDADAPETAQLTNTSESTSTDSPSTSTPPKKRSKRVKKVSPTELPQAATEGSQDFAAALGDVPGAASSSSSSGSRRRQTLIQKASVHFLEDDASFERLVNVGLKLALQSSTAAPATSSSSQSTFKARLHTLYMKDFMGIRGELTIPFYRMNSGIWLIDGKNGAGKSTIFEGLVWAQFGEFLRSGMQKDYAINDNAKACTVRLIYENGLVIERSRRRGRTESLRTYQLKTRPTEIPYGESPMMEDDGDEELLMNREPSSLVQAETSRPALKKSRKKSNTSSSSEKIVPDSKFEGMEDESVVSHSSRTSTKEGHLSPQLQYEEESELGDIRNTQKHLSERLGVNFDTFTKSVVLGQNILNNFVSGNKEMRRQIIEEMLGLEKFNSWLEAAKKDRVKVESEMDLLFQRRDMLKQELSGLLSYNVAKAQRIAEKESELASLRQEKEELEKLAISRISLLEQDLDAARTKLHSPSMLELEFELESTTEGAFTSSIANELAELATFQANTFELLRHLKASIGVAEGSDDKATCASCGQAVTQVHIDAMISKAVALNEVALRTFQLDVSPQLSPSQFQDAMSATTLLDDVTHAISSHQRKLTDKIGLVNLRQHLKLSLSRLETSIALDKSAENTKTEALVRSSLACEIELEQLRARKTESSEEALSLEQGLDEVNGQLESSKEQLSMIRFWEMAFDKQSKGTVGTVRAFVFEDVVRDLNVICNSYMDQLQSKEKHHLKVTLSADLEIEQIYGKRSGGERRRTDLAILFSMFELVRSQSRFVPDFLMLDEVFDALDQDGREMVGQVLGTLAKRLEKILVITHTDVASGLSVAGSLDVKMQFDSIGNPSGTEIEVSHR